MKKLLLILLCFSILGGCGKRGKLEYPPGTVYPRQYPAPRAPKAVPEKQPAQINDKQPESILEMNELLKAE